MKKAAKVKFKKGMVTLESRYRGEQGPTVPGYILEGLGLARWPGAGKGWSIVHLKTGLSIISNAGKRLQTAKSIVIAITSMSDWSQDPEYYLKYPGLSREVRRVADNIRFVQEGS